MEYHYHFRRLLTFLLLTVPFVLTCAQQTNSKFSMTTQFFLEEQREQAEQPANAPDRVTNRSHDDLTAPETPSLIVSPVTIDGVAYISCFIHLNDPSDLDAVRALGVEVQQTFPGQDFVTALAPVAQLEALAEIDNVTLIRVARRMRPMTDVSRNLTHVDDLLNVSPAAKARGFNTKYDGSGVLLGILDIGIDYRHIAFMDTAGNSRVKLAIAYDEETSQLYIYNEEVMKSYYPTTDNSYEDHGTHTASTAGGSSVIVRGDSIVVTNAHDSATYGGMAPGADLLLAGINYLSDTYIMLALQRMVDYADTVGGGGKPLVISNSWGGNAGAHDGVWSCSSFISQHFSDDNPNHIILFAAANNAGSTSKGESGGFFVKKEAVNKDNTLGTILRSTQYGNTTNGYSYTGMVFSAWSPAHLACCLHVLDTTGTILCTDTIADYVTRANNLYDINPNGDTIYYYEGYNGGYLKIYSYEEDGRYNMLFMAKNFEASRCDTSYTDQGRFYTSHYTLAVEIFPDSATADVNMWAGEGSYFSNLYQTPGYTWLNGTDDMCVSDEAVTPEAISVGAYVSKEQWQNYMDSTVLIKDNNLGDIASFSSYATAEMSPTGLAYPWITAPGCKVVAGVNHYHTAELDGSSFYSPSYKRRLIVNDSLSPYAAMEGTSMATPVVAGIVALWLQAAQEVGKDLTGSEVKNIMRRTAIHDSFTEGTYAARFGKGKIDALAGIHFITDDVLDLYDTASNDTKISVNSDTVLNVMLCGRTLYKDNGWNTLCLPFDLPLAGSVLAGATLVELDPTSSGYDGTTLTLNFTSASSIEAGKPYLIKWPEGSDITYPLFENVALQNASTIVISDDNSVAFIGIYSPVTLNANSWRTLSMGANNTLYYPDSDMSLGAFRAVFLLNNASQAPSRIVLNVNGETVATDLGVLQESNPGFPQVEDADGRGTKFITNGQLYILRGGVIYDSLGRKVKPQYNNR